MFILIASENKCHKTFQLELFLWTTELCFNGLYQRMCSQI